MQNTSIPKISGPVKAVHQYVNMCVVFLPLLRVTRLTLVCLASLAAHRSSYTFTLPNGTSVTTCPPAMGYSFAGGTTA